MRATRLVRPGAPSGSYTSMSRPLPSRYARSTSLVRTSWPEATVPSFTHWLRMSCWSSSTVCAVSASFMPLAPRLRRWCVARQELADPADRLGQVRRRAPIFLDLEVRGQARDLGAGLGRVRLVGARLQQERRAAAAHELAAHREDEVAAEQVVAEFLDGGLGQARILGEHLLGEAADDVIPGVAVLVEADRVLQHGGGDALGRQLAGDRQYEPPMHPPITWKRRKPRWSI